MNQLISIFIAGLLVNNILFSKFLDSEQLFKILNDDNKVIYGFNFTLVLVVLFSSIIAYFIDTLVLIPFNLVHLKLLVFIFISIVSVYLAKLLSYKYCSFHNDSENYFNLILVNNVLIQVLIDNSSNLYGIFEVIINSISVSLGFVVMIYIFLGIKDRLSFSSVPKCFKGLPILLIVFGLMALAISGLAGLV